MTLNHVRRWIAAFIRLMRAVLITVTTAAAAMAADGPALIPVDDSYTVSQRYDAYKSQYPELEWPTLSFETGQRVRFDRRYKKIGARELHLDIFLPLPSRATGHGILFVHGGGWRSGNKSNFHAAANLLAQRGYAVFVPEYRLSPESGYPAGLLDISDALVWIKARAADYGVKPDRIALGGGSSGGQMAALLAHAAHGGPFKSDPADDTSVSALIDLDGVLDFLAPLAIKHENAAGSASPAALWLGGSMEQATARWREASAVRYVTEQSPPSLIISSGQLRFTAGKDELQAALERHQVRFEYFEFANAPHTFWLFEPYLSQVVGLIDGFLRGGQKPVSSEKRTATATSRYVVSQSCGEMRNCFPQIQAALDAADRDVSTDWIRIEIAAGDFHEKVTIRRRRVHLLGAGRQHTRLHFDAVAQDAGRFHRDRWGTAGSATLTIDADQVTVEGITVENTFDYLANDARAADDPLKIANSQALALLLDIHSDRVLIEEVALVGFQDTLFGHGRRALIRDSFISGNVDFIFGNGQLLIMDSTVQSRRRAASFAPGEFASFIVAPSTQIAKAMGIVIYRSRLTREAGVPDGSVALGRPWHPTTTFPDGRYADPNAIGQASFIDCYMDAHIHEDHWTSMHGTARDGSKTAVFPPQDARFFESGSHGPGARRRDIGITWRDRPTIEAIKAAFFVDWPIATR